MYMVKKAKDYPDHKISKKKLPISHRVSVWCKLYALKVPWPRAKVADSKNRKECYHNYFTTKLSQRLINTLEVSALA